ncbi:hypothetical protein KCV01_g6192, partial [Aureobasidium melanogenum]
MQSNNARDFYPSETDFLPLTGPQLDIYQDQLMVGAVPTYNIGGYLDFHGGLDVVSFDQAWRGVVEAHDALRIRLIDRGGDTPVQYMTTDMSVSLPVLDMSDRAVPEEDAQAWMSAGINTPFDLVEKPLFRSTLIKLADDRYHWFICVHHLIADGWALDMIFQALADRYTAIRNGGELAPNAPSYVRFIESDQAYRGSRQFERDTAYWLEKYADVPEPLIPAPHAHRFRDASTGTREHRWPLPADMDAAIDTLVAEHRSTRFQVMLGLFYAFFLRTSQRDELSIGLSVLNRKDVEFRKTAGMFTNVIAMRMGFDRANSFVDLLDGIGASLRKDYRHQRFPVGELNRQLGLFARHRSQVYDLSVSYEHGGSAMYFGHTPAYTIKCTNEHENTPLRLCIRDELERKTTSMYFIYGQPHYDEVEIATLERRFGFFMRELLMNPHVPVGSLPIVTDEEADLLDTWNDTGASVEDGPCVQALFERQVSQHPDAIALAHGDQSLTYAELNARANRLAHFLARRGVGPDDRVALCVARSTSMVVGILAILKAGGAYVPIDPGYPSERAAYVLRDAAPVLVLLDEAGRHTLGDTAPAQATIAIDDTVAWEACSPDNRHDDRLSDRHLAYVIYTSGSTGQPKGVTVEHRNLRHQVAALRQAYGLAADERLLQFASMAFDMSVEEIFPALLTGATLVLRTDAWLASPQAFVDACAEHGVTSLNLPSAFWAQLALVEPELALPSALRRVSVGGDALSLPAVAAWFQRIGHRPRLFNAYGPTEATVNATVLAVETPLAVSVIGRPLAHARIHILDAYGQRVALGDIGEIHIGGAGVARGYLDRPELTAERFIHDPFAGSVDARMYRTGDLGRHLPDGNIEFLGRNDHQVKIRGYRIEPGDIEAGLATHATVREAFVMTIGEDADKRLVAYVVPQDGLPGTTSLAATWRAHVAEALPEYMVPAAFVCLAAFPLTPNGKIDRKALPMPDETAFARRAYEAPAGHVEVTLAAFWRELLGMERIGRQDHFFDLGGDSLKAIRLLGRVGQAFETPLPLVTLFNHPTLVTLASAIDAARRDSDRQVLPPILPMRHGDSVPLSHAQQRLWFMATLDNANATYHVSLVVSLDGDLDTDALHHSLDRLLARHDALRTVFLSVEGEPRAALLPADTPFPLAYHRLDAKDDVEAELARIARDDAHLPYDLEHGPLVRARLIEVSPQRHTLLLGMHHIVSDGWSVNLLAREIS